MMPRIPAGMKKDMEKMMGGKKGGGKVKPPVKKGGKK